MEGYIKNNTGICKHIFKRTVYPGQSISISEARKVFTREFKNDDEFLSWLNSYVPNGWVVEVLSKEKSESLDGRNYKEVLLANPEVVSKSIDSFGEDSSLSLQYATAKVLSKLTYKEVSELKLKDNPKRVLEHVTSVPTLRRALTLCKRDSRKATLAKAIQNRIRKLTTSL